MRRGAIALLISLSLATIPNSFVFANNNHQGDKKGIDINEIKVFQSALKQDGTYDYEKLNTHFETITGETVIEFQEKYGLKPHGIIGESTIREMKELGTFNEILNPALLIMNSQGVYKKGMTHDDIKVIQQVLKEDGAYQEDSFSTYFCSNTENAVKAFQEKYKLKSDGIVGPSTLNKMQALGLVKYQQRQIVSRGARREGFGENLDWWKEVKDKVINRGDDIIIQDFQTGKKFKVKVTYGTNHADVEALTKEDTKIMKNIWDGFSWERRPVLVHKGNRIIAASMTNMPHAGLDSKPEGATVSNRSGGYGRGYNLDKVKDNGMNGVVDLHFKNSSRHKDGRRDSKHQSAIKKATGSK